MISVILCMHSSKLSELGILLLTASRAEHRQDSTNKLNIVDILHLLHCDDTFHARHQNPIISYVYILHP